MPDTKFPNTPYGCLPPVMRVLCVSSDPANVSSWLEEALASDSAMAIKLESASLEAAMGMLRQEVIDAVIVNHDDRLDGIGAVGPLRAASPECLAIVVIGNEPCESMTALCLEASADAYVHAPVTEVRTLLWTLARAVERQFLLREAKRTRQQQDQAGQKQFQEAMHQIRAERGLLMEHMGDSDPHPPSWLVERFQALLRIYVVSGRGTLRDEVRQLAARLEVSEVTLAEALAAHSIATEQLIRGLPHRPMWHILGRARLLSYELILQLRCGAAETNAHRSSPR